MTNLSTHKGITGYMKLLAANAYEQKLVFLTNKVMLLIFRLKCIEVDKNPGRP